MANFETTAKRTSYDVIVVGGGPAGATAATLVAEQGHSVLLLERATKPEFKIGESLMPATYWTLSRLGCLDKMQQGAFQPKSSVQFFTSKDKASKPFYFFENDTHESAHTWQVDRAEFDQMLLTNAADKGAEVLRGASVQDVLLEDQRAYGVEVRYGRQRETSKIEGKVVVDATGQSAMLANRLDLKKPYPCLENVSYFTHFKGAHRDEGVDEGATLVLQTDNQSGWFWYIPLTNNRVSVGVVGSMPYLNRSTEGGPQQVFDEEVARCPEIGRRIAGAEQMRPVQVLRDFSYRSKKMAGNGWILVGDAFGFLDPIYSSGVFLALKSGEFAADAIVQALRQDDVSEANLGQFAPEYLKGMESIRRLVYAFYNRDFSFASFLKKRPEMLEPVIDLLVGNVYRKPVNHLFGPLGEVCWLPDEEFFEAQGNA